MYNYYKRDLLEQLPKQLEQSKKSEGYFAELANALKRLFVDVNETGYPNLDRVTLSKAIVLTPNMIDAMRNIASQEHMSAFLNFNKLHHINGKTPVAGDTIIQVTKSFKRTVLLLGEDAKSLPPRIRDNIFNKLKVEAPQDQTVQLCTPDNTRFMPEDYAHILQPPPQDTILEQSPA